MKHVMWWPDIATWRRSSAHGKSSIAEVERDGEAESNNANPYWSAREKLGKPLRQEAFSFAASTIVSLTKTHSSHDFPTVWNMCKGFMWMGSSQNMYKWSKVNGIEEPLKAGMKTWGFY
jgi:hypothetical protein